MAPWGHRRSVLERQYTRGPCGARAPRNALSHAGNVALRSAIRAWQSRSNPLHGRCLRASVFRDSSAGEQAAVNRWVVGRVLLAEPFPLNRHLPASGSRRVTRSPPLRAAVEGQAAGICATISLAMATPNPVPFLDLVKWPPRSPKAAICASAMPGPSSLISRSAASPSCREAIETRDFAHLAAFSNRTPTSR